VGILGLRRAAATRHPGERGDAVELVSVTRVNDAGQANVVKGVLEQAGIEVVVAGTGSEDVFVTPETNPYHILVPETDAERAMDVLAQFDAMPDEGDDEE
jgi:hypothetical protein